MQKKRKMTETLAHGYSSENTQREPPNEYQYDRVLDGFQKSLCALAFAYFWKVASAFEGLIKEDCLHLLRKCLHKICVDDSSSFGGPFLPF